MGTPQFAVASLEILLKNKYDVVGVVTAPDKAAGRGQQLQQSAVKEFAVANNLHVLQPVNLKDPAFIEELRSLKADLQIVVAFRMLPEVVWNMPPLGTYNIHASLLPQYRGAAPINRAIMNGEKETGVTSFKLQHEIDTGNILLQEKVSIGENMNAGELHDLLMQKGAEVLLHSVKQIEEGKAVLTEQKALLNSGEEIKHAPKIFKEDCRIDWNKDVHSIHNLIRGLSPYPCAWSELLTGEQKVNFKFFAVRPEKKSHSEVVGSVASDGKTFFKIAAADGFIYADELQMAGKRKLPVTEFLKGFKPEAHSHFE
jgi:methionyl-tRNA formyltransferase